MQSSDPTEIIGEILGEPASVMRNPVNAGYQCPFIGAECTKRSQRVAGPYPVCSVYRQGRLVAVCPNRFFENEFYKDVITHCWMGEKPQHPKLAHQVQMKRFGTVDFVIADVEPSTNQVKDFVSVELQAVDITGSVEPAYHAVTSSSAMATKPSYGFNWANVRKRYINQLIQKGFFHHHWGSRIVSVLQTPLYEEFRKSLQFDELAPGPACNVIFMLYDFVPAPEKGTGAQKLALDRVVGTSHNSLMMGPLYRTPPDRQAFIDRIRERL